MNEQPSGRVAITDIDMPFMSMVRFMVKWAIAAIPALMILMVLGAVFWGVLAGVVASLALRHDATPAAAQKSVPSSSETASQSDSVPPAAAPPAKPDPAIAAYLPNLEVKGVHVSKNVLGETGVFGEVKNAGGKTLKTVAITIYCLDDDGNPIFEKTYEPVRSGSFDSDVAAPLKPHYSRQFGVKLDDAPSEWHQAVRVAVTHFEFE